MSAAFQTDSHSAGSAENRLERIGAGLHDTVSDRSSGSIEQTISAMLIAKINTDYGGNRMGTLLGPASMLLV